MGAPIPNEPRAEDNDALPRARAHLLLPLVLLAAAGGALVVYLALSPKTPEYREAGQSTSSWNVAAAQSFTPYPAIRSCYGERIIKDLIQAEPMYVNEAEHWLRYRNMTAPDWQRYSEEERQEARPRQADECRLILPIASKRLRGEELSKAAACCDAHAQNPFPVTR